MNARSPLGFGVLLLTACHRAPVGTPPVAAPARVVLDSPRSAPTRAPRPSLSALSLEGRDPFSREAPSRTPCRFLGEPPGRPQDTWVCMNRTLSIAPLPTLQLKGIVGDSNGRRRRALFVDGKGDGITVLVGDKISRTKDEVQRINAESVVLCSPDPADPFKKEGWEQFISLRSYR